ncbi:hypothetical protein BU15DRAFT_66511 [Melanogaster broomeanus]|nr:hypothetical protein BU15DRAFT_66511 [Melanogaster broomeanus]
MPDSGSCGSTGVGSSQEGDQIDRLFRRQGPWSDLYFPKPFFVPTVEGFVATSSRRFGGFVEVGHLYGYASSIGVSQTRSLDPDSPGSSKGVLGVRLKSPELRGFFFNDVGLQPSEGVLEDLKYTRRGEFERNSPGGDHHHRVCLVQFGSGVRSSPSSASVDCVSARADRGSVHPDLLLWQCTPT